MRYQTDESILRQHFLKYQCKTRQNAIRKNSGKPSQSMRPAVVVDDERLTRVVLLINKKQSHSNVPELKHMALRTVDPKQRYESALEFLAAEYYQYSEEFTDQLTALFGPSEPLVEYLDSKRSCILEFDQPRQYFNLPCRVRNLPVEDYLYQATYWHNCLFNPYMPPGVQVLEFQPDWTRATMDLGQT